jgi:hypothetical protein
MMTWRYRPCAVISLVEPVGFIQILNFSIMSLNQTIELIFDALTGDSNTLWRLPD